MKAGVILAAIMVSSVSVISAAQAQWPLGKELGTAIKNTECVPHITATGRFQIFISSQAKGHTFMLDTDTGKVWIMKKDPASGDFSFQRVPVQEVDGEKTGKPSASETKSDREKSSDRK
jgi:hypothetical protein